MKVVLLHWWVTKYITSPFDLWVSLNEGCTPPLMGHQKYFFSIWLVSPSKWRLYSSTDGSPNILLHHLTCESAYMKVVLIHWWVTTYITSPFDLRVRLYEGCTHPLMGHQIYYFTIWLVSPPKRRLCSSTEELVQRNSPGAPYKDMQSNPFALW
jgi:hypothetical protein